MSPESTRVNEGVRAKLATLLFLIALLLGNAALIGALEKNGGSLSVAVFATACALWWASYRISFSVNGKGMTLGLLALGLWIFALVGALALDFHHYIVDHVFWAVSTVLLALIVAVTFRGSQLDAPNATNS
jgi:hypothetical protein